MKLLTTFAMALVLAFCSAARHAWASDVLYPPNANVNQIACLVSGNLSTNTSTVIAWTGQAGTPDAGPPPNDTNPVSNRWYYNFNGYVNLYNGSTSPVTVTVTTTFNDFSSCGFNPNCWGVLSEQVTLQPGYTDVPWQAMQIIIADSDARAAYFSVNPGNSSAVSCKSAQYSSWTADSDAD